MRKLVVLLSVLLLVVLTGTEAGIGQPYGPPYGQPNRLRIVQGEPAAVCQDQSSFRSWLQAYANGNRFRMREVMAQSCVILPRGARVIVLPPPMDMRVWQAQSRQPMMYRVVQVRILDGVSRGYTGYMLVDELS
jgi:hypothetical protein